MKRYHNRHRRSSPVAEMSANRKELSMAGLSRKGTARSLRRGLYGVFAACMIGGGATAAVAVPSATAATDPCAASEIARTIGSVATNTGNYLDTHPDTNAAITSATQQSGPQAAVALKTYFAAHPQAGKG